MSSLPKMFQCSCYREVIAVEPDEEDYTIDLSFWQCGNHATPLSTRIRHIVNVIRRGIPFTDMVVLSLEEAEALGNYLIGEASRLKLKEACEEAATRGAGSTPQVHYPLPGEREEK